MGPGRLRHRSNAFITSPPHRPDVLLDLQRVPLVREAGPPEVRVPGDGEPLHRQGGVVGRGELHLRGDQHRHKDPGAGAAHTAGATQRR